MITLNNEDCLETLKKLEDNTIDLCEKCMSEFDEFMTKGKSSDEK